MVADEPRAVLVGRDILSAGGSAADAAVGVYFTLAVTMPSSASLGGGGMCLVFDRETGSTQALDFIAREPADIPRATTRPSAVPGNVRGFFTLHAKHGRLRWGQLVVPAENLARFGTQVSRAFAHDLAQVGDALLEEKEAGKIFGRPDGKGLVREGDYFRQIDLATVLSSLRVRGPGAFYDSALAGTVVKAVVAAGGSLTRRDLRAYRPRWLDTLRVPFGNLTVHFTPPPAASGAVAAQIWSMAQAGDRFAEGGQGERAHLLAETSMRAFADRSGWLTGNGNSRVAPGELVAPARLGGLMASYNPNGHTPAETLRPPPRSRPENPAGTSFVAVDRNGNAVACALTLNNLFGTGRFAPGTGILLAAAPDPSVGRGAVSLTGMMIVNHHVNEFHFASAASGGVTAPTAMAQVAARHYLGGEPLERALAAKRVHHNGVPDVTYHEKGLAPAVVSELARRRHKTAATPVLGRVTAISCPDGIPPNPATCTFDVDPRSFGLATSADR